MTKPSRLSIKTISIPSAKAAIKKYLFILEESTAIGGGDSLFSISFRPLLNTNFDGLKGIINIHSDGWAIQNVSAEPYRNESGFSIRIQQMYEKIDGKRWFPVQLNTDLLFKAAVVDDGINQYPMVGIGKSYFRDIVLNPELVKRQFSNIAIEVAPDAADKDANYWMQYRIDSLNQRTLETYRYMDSIGKANDFDRIAKSLQTMQTGRIPRLRCSTCSSTSFWATMLTKHLCRTGTANQRKIFAGSKIWRLLGGLWFSRQNS